MAQPQQASQSKSATKIARGYARGALGALLVSMPLLATMEMWWQGFYMPSWKMILFLITNFGVLIILEHYSGFQEHTSFPQEVQDALSAYGIGLVIGAMTLFLLNNLRAEMSLQEILGKIILESIPLSIGASIAISQLGGGGNEREQARKKRAGLLGSLALSLAGAWYFGFNIAPTVEPLMLGARIHWWHALGLLLASLLISHAIVYALGFKGGHELPEEGSWWSAILTYGVASTVVALLVGAFFLWTFGRIGLDTGLAPTLHMVIVMGFVNSLGASAAKLIL